jgi:hypothetical protein
MIAWVECSGRQPYIAGIADSVDEALRLQRALPPEVAGSSRVECRHDLEWPCFLVESSNGFAFCTPDEATALVASHLDAGALDDEDRRLTVYRIVGRFVPTVAGRDEMGRVSHTHPGATEAARIAADGIAHFWRS